jgi:hypothetical protein
VSLFLHRDPTKAFRASGLNAEGDGLLEEESGVATAS